MEFWVSFVRLRALVAPVIIEAATISISPVPIDTYHAYMSLFLHTDTSGTRLLELFLGDGSATVQHSFNAGTGEVSLCQQGGKLITGGVAVQLPYLGAAPGGLGRIRLHDR